MAKKRGPIDLWDLFAEGRSSGISFGVADIDDARKVLGIRSRGWEGRLPFSSWFLEGEDCELFFQGIPPRFYSFKVKVSVRSLSQEAAALVGNDSISQERAGSNAVLLCGQPLSRFSTMRALFESLPHAGDFSVRPMFDKSVSFELNKNGRHISLGYQLAFREIESGIFDADYFLYAVWVMDLAVDAELSKTLPSDTETRETVLSRIAMVTRNASQQSPIDK